jgi:hypothetical protein
MLMFKRESEDASTTEEVENACFTLNFDKCLSLPSVERRSSRSWEKKERRVSEDITKNAIKEEQKERKKYFNSNNDEELKVNKLFQSHNDGDYR